MQRRRLGTSTLEVPPVILGTWALGGWLWGGTERNDPEAAVLASLDAGIGAVDTAPAYGFGLSEAWVGRAVRERRNEVLLATKCGLVWDGRDGSVPFFAARDLQGRPVEIRRCLRARSVRSECDASLKRLGVDVIDLYQCHWPDPGTPVNETLEALAALQDQGKIRAFGVSNFGVAELEQCLKSGFHPVSNQVKYSLLSREIEADVLPFCRKNGIAVIAYSPMEMGLLTGKIGLGHSFPETDTRRNRPWFQPAKRARVLEALEQILPIAGRLGVTLGQLAVAWVNAQPGVTASIVGARDRRQAEMNARAAGVRLPPEDEAVIREVFLPLELDEPYDPATVKR